MDQSWKQKFKLGTLAFAVMVMMSACSSSQIEDGEATAESVADVSGEATTDVVPDADPSLAPVENGLVAENATPEAIATTEPAPAADPALDLPPATDPGLSTAPAPALEEPAAVTADSSLDLPKDDTLALEPAPIVENTERDYLSTTPDAIEAEPAVKHKKRRKKRRHGTSRVAQVANGEGVQYTVKRGDTLMKIAFENYGDLYRWREIYEANRNQIVDPNNVPPGTNLSLNGSGMVQVERNGEQYLIQRGETLGLISKNVYGTPRKWKRLWENNRQLIKDPNKIYAGFYLFYQPEGKLTNGEPAAIEGEARNAPIQASGEAPRMPASSRQ